MFQQNLPLSVQLGVQTFAVLGLMLLKFPAMPAFQILQLGSLVFDQFYFVSVADECDIWVVGDGAAEFIDETGIHVFAFAEAYLAGTALR